MDLLILLTYDLIFMINNIVLPYLVMTEPFSGYTTIHGWSILVFCLFACVIVELKVRETLYKVGLFGGWLFCMLSKQILASILVDVTVSFSSLSSVRVVIP